MNDIHYTYLARKYCYENGYKIYPIPYGSLFYKIVVAKATKYKWSELSNEQKKDFEVVNGVVYRIKVGDVLYKKTPSNNEEKYWNKLDELHQLIYEKSKKNEHKEKIQQ